MLIERLLQRWSIDVVAIDLRGTLVHTPSVTDLTAELKAQGFPNDAAHALQRRLNAKLGGLSYPHVVLDWTAFSIQLLANWVKRDGKTLDMLQAEEDFRSRYLRSSRGLLAVQSLYRLASTISKTGRRLVVAADGPYERERELLRRIYGDLGGSISLICSDSLGCNKLSDTFFVRAARQLDTTPSRMLVIGDRMDKDILPAIAVGCKSVYVSYFPPDARCAAHINALEEILH